MFIKMAAYPNTEGTFKKMLLLSIILFLFYV